MEDFAQVLNKYPEEKYDGANYETLGRIVLSLAGPEALDEFVRRLAFIIVTGNGDAHLKNWSLVYPDGVQAALSPAYDLVSTLEFIPVDALGLNLGKTKRWEELGEERFATFARRVGAAPEHVLGLVRQTVTRAMDLWDEVRRSTPVSALLTTRLEQHWQRVPLLRRP